MATGILTHPYRILVFGSGFLCAFHPKVEIFVGWDEVREIKVVTTGDGPFVCDVWLLFLTKKGAIALPQTIGGFDDIFEAISQLDAFDFNAFIQAMSSVRLDSFVCWRRE